MDRRKIICVVVIMLMLSLIGYKLNINKVNNNKVVEEVKQNIKVNRKQFAMYIKDNGVYKEYTSSDKFPEGYVIDESMSKCYDADNQEITGVTFTGNSNNITVTSGKTVYCYLYFYESKPMTTKELLNNLPADSGLSASKLGDMRRYQGTNVKNYICINDNGAKCNSGSDQMYRIIGIVEDGNEAGQIKVIKETKYGDYAWNNNDSPSQCSGTTCSWPNSSLAKTLNSTFLSSLPSKVQNKIVSRQWYYGDLHYTYTNEDANTIYQIETGQTNTTYYDLNNFYLIYTDKWQKTSGTSKIGLIYLHDYYWQSTQNNCHYSSSYWLCGDNGWMHLSQNGNSSDYEWTMSRCGRYSKPANDVRAFNVYPDGGFNGNVLTGKEAVRPVFYLSADIRIKEGGTGEKTNPYILDFS